MDNPTSDQTKPVLSVRLVLNQAFNGYKENARVLLPVSAVCSLIIATIAAAGASAGRGTSLLALAPTVAIGTTYSGFVAAVFAEPRTAKPNWAKSLKISASKLGAMIGASIVFGIVLTIGLLLLIFPGLWIATLWALFIPILIIEGGPPLKALSRSSDLVQGNTWRVFATLLLVYGAYVVLLGGSRLILISANQKGVLVQQLVNLPFAIFLGPVLTLVVTAIYFQLRRNDASDTLASTAATNTSPRL